MSDVSMRRLRELEAIPVSFLHDATDTEAASMASELIRLRELIVSGADQRIERNRCRALLEAGE